MNRSDTLKIAIFLLLLIPTSCWEVRQYLAARDCTKHGLVPVKVPYTFGRIKCIR